MRRAPALRLMPLHLDLDWREAQLGQLARIVTGSDPGWRGDLTGELHLDGSPDTAQITIRLRAAGVHRAEFTPTSPLDFDANCAFAYHYAQRSLQNLACDSPLGDGRIHVTGEKLGEEAPPSSRLHWIASRSLPASMRCAPSQRHRSDLEASGTVSGKIIYEVATVKTPQTEKPAKPARNHLAKAAAERTGPAHRQPVRFGLCSQRRRPHAAHSITQSHAGAHTLRARRSRPARSFKPFAGYRRLLYHSCRRRRSTHVECAPLALRLSGRGARTGKFCASQRNRQCGWHPANRALAALAGDPIAVDLTAEGPWMPTEQLPLPSASAPQPATAAIPASQLWPHLVARQPCLPLPPPFHAGHP